MQLWPKSCLGRVILARDGLGYPPIILGSLASSLVLSVRSPQSNEFNNIILATGESFFRTSPQSHPKGKSSTLATILCDMALASCAQSIGPDLNVWLRLDKIEDLPWKFGIGTEIPVSIRTAYLKEGNMNPWMVVWSCFSPCRLKSRESQEKREKET